MRHNIKVQSPGAMLLGVLFAAATAYVLLEDIVHGAAISTSHILTAVALVGTIAAGHMAVPALKQRRVLAALGLGVLFAAGTAYTIVSAGARNAEVAARKSEAIEQANADRAVIAAERKAAQAMLDEENGKLARECRSGAGTRCKGVQASIGVYQAAVAGHDAKLAKLGPVRSANAGMAHAARVFAVLSGVPAGSIEAGLVLVMPFLLVLVVELGTITFWSVALRSETIAETPPPADKAPLPVLPEIQQSETARVIDWAQAFEKKHARRPTQAEIRAAFDLAKSTAHRIYHTHLRVA